MCAMNRSCRMVDVNGIPRDPGIHLDLALVQVRGDLGPELERAYMLLGPELDFFKAKRNTLTIDKNSTTPA